MFWEIVLRNSKEIIKLEVAKGVHRAVFTAKGIDYKEIETLRIPQDIVINQFAFDECTGLRELTIAKGGKIGQFAFEGCTALKRITIGEGVRIIHYAFGNCTGLTELTIPEGVTIGLYAFQGCTGLTKLSIAEEVTIAPYAFNRCTGLTELTVSERVTIGIYAFANCISLTKLSIPEGVTIAPYAFNRCTGLTKLTILRGVIISENAFQDCTNLKDISVFTGVSLLNTGLMPEVSISRFGLYCREENNTLLAFTKDLFMSKVMGLFILCMKRRSAINDTFPVLPLEMLGLIVRTSALCNVGLDARSGFVSSEEILVRRNAPEWLLDWKYQPFFSKNLKIDVARKTQVIDFISCTIL